LVVDACTETVRIDDDRIVVVNLFRRVAMPFEDIKTIEMRSFGRGIQGLVISCASSRATLGSAAFTNETLVALQRMLRERATSAEDLSPPKGRRAG
jgi:hypothetical protein